MGGIKWLLAMGAALAVLFLFASRSARADLCFAGPENLPGAGFGNVTVILTVRDTGMMKSEFESRRAGVCNSGITAFRGSKFEGRNAKDEENAQVRFPHTSSPRVTNALQIANLLNRDEPQDDSEVTTLAELLMAVYMRSSHASFASGNFAGPVDFSGVWPESRLEKSAWAFDSDTAEDAEGHAAIDHTSPDSTVPEPASLMLLGTGLLTMGGLVRYRIRSARRKMPPTTH